MYKFVLWGYGQRGKRFLELCPSEHIVAIIDQNYEKRKEPHEDIPVISYEIYKQEYMQYDILITPLESYEIEEILGNDGIYTYHLLRDCPSELLGFYGPKWLKDLPVKIDDKQQYVIYGLNIYALLLRDYLCSTYGLEKLEIVSDISDEQKNEKFRKKYKFIRENRYFALNEEILNASGKGDKSVFGKNKIQEVFDFFGKIPEYNALKLIKYKNKYAGERCFIIASGPSLQVADLETLHKNNCKCMAVNKIYLLFEKTEWRPDIYVACDPKMVQSSFEEIKKCDVKDKFVADVYESLKNRNFDGINKYHCQRINCQNCEPKFSNDITKGTYAGGSVIYDCIQIAVYMGFKTLYILGADHNYTSNQSDSSNHFHKDYYKGIQNPNKYIKEDVECAFQAARQYAESHGIKIYNATRGGKLEVFERVDFDSLFEEKKEW